ncbi:MAG TPA: class I SAM-dependent methyltransferase [Kofleriaceae bacterium]|nr:class I SAM-dependent methyltransferase [Kofleriaceae bacterium]
MDPEDVPTSVDFQNPAHARQWTDETPRKRPWRTDFFLEFAKALGGKQLRILELGSGPCHLARAILERCDVAEYLALDFSDAMHDLAREHLGELASRVTFVTRDFRAPDWTTGLSALDAIVTMQAVHETRHKRRALPLLAQARAVLRPGGQLLYCDHYFEEGKLPGLMLDRFEQPEMLRAAGYSNVVLVRDHEGMALYAAVVASP